MQAVSTSVRAPAPAARRAVAARAVSPYGIPMPTDRVEPILSGNTVEQNKAEAKAWIAKYRDRKSGKAPAAAAAAPKAPEPVDPEIAKGQATAIWTGALSIGLGLAYFVLVFILDSRGGEMLPPPPEAFGP